MNRQKKQKQRKISSSTGQGRSRLMPIGLVQMEINGRPTPEQIQAIDDMGWRSLAAYRLLLRQLMAGARPILQAQMDWRVAADVPSTVWYISQSPTNKFVFTGLRNADGHDIEQVRLKVMVTFPGTIVVRPRGGGALSIRFHHVGLMGDREDYSFQIGVDGVGVWSGRRVPRLGGEDIVLIPDGMGIHDPGIQGTRNTERGEGASP